MAIIGIKSNKKSLIFMLFALLFLNLSCKTETQTEEQKTCIKIKRELSECYRLDSAKAIRICKRLEYLYPNSEYVKTIEYLGLSEVYEYWGVAKKSLHYTDMAYKIAAANGFYEEKGKACLQYAKLCTQNNIMLKHLQQFEALSESHKIKDPQLHCELNYIYGYYYNEIEQRRLSKIYFEKALKIAIKNNLNLEIGRCLVPYSEMFSNTSKIKYKLLNSAEKICNTFNPLETGDVYYSKGLLFFNNQQYDSAKVYAMKAQKTYSSHPHPYHPSIVEQLLGDIYMKEGNYMDAKKNYDLFLKKSQFISTQVWASQKLFQYYLTLKDYKQALKYRLNIADLTETGYSKQKIAELSDIRAQFEKELTGQKYVSEKKQYQLVLLFTLITTIGLITFIILYRRSKDLEIKLAQGESAKRDIEFEYKQRELATHTLYLDQHLNLLDNINKHIQEISENQTPLRNQLNPLIKLINSHISNSHNWGDYKMHFEAVSPLFFETLRNRTPSLTDLDLKHCVYIKMHMTPKQVAQMLGITPKSVTLSRVRLKKKLALDVSESLSEFIQNI